MTYSAAGKTTKMLANICPCVANLTKQMLYESHTLCQVSKYCSPTFMYTVMSLRKAVWWLLFCFLLIEGNVTFLNCVLHFLTVSVGRSEHLNNDSVQRHSLSLPVLFLSEASKAATEWYPCGIQKIVTVNIYCLIYQLG